MNKDTWRKTLLGAVAVFAVLFAFLVFSGGACERYERKMERQRLMREYLDSQRSEGQKKILERSK